MRQHRISVKFPFSYMSEQSQRNTVFGRIPSERKPHVVLKLLTSGFLPNIPEVGSEKLHVVLKRAVKPALNILRNLWFSCHLSCSQPTSHHLFSSSCDWFCVTIMHPADWWRQITVFDSKYVTPSAFHKVLSGGLSRQRPPSTTLVEQTQWK